MFLKNIKVAVCLDGCTVLSNSVISRISIRRLETQLLEFKNSRKF